MQFSTTSMLSTALLAIAFGSTGPALTAVEIANDTASVRISLRVQSRIESADVTSHQPSASPLLVPQIDGIGRDLLFTEVLPAGTPQGTIDDYANEQLGNQLGLDPRLVDRFRGPDRSGSEADLSGRVTTSPQDVDFSFRRIRLTFLGHYRENTRYFLTIAGDNLGRHDNNFRANDRRQPDIQYAWVRHYWKLAGLDHYLQFGLDLPLFVPSVYDSSGKLLFPTSRPLGRFGSGRGIGLRYVINWDSGFVGIDLQNARNDSRNYTASARLETSFKPEWRMVRDESKRGAAGFGHALGLEIGTQTDTSTDDQGFSQIGIDYNLHWNQLTMNADAVYRRQQVADTTLITSLNPVDWYLDNASADFSTQDQWGMSAQAGYAIPTAMGPVIEPALRLAIMDRDQPAGQDTPLPSFDTMDSGWQVDIGVNAYFAGHGNKLQLALTHWQAKDGPAEKTVLRLQHQLNF